MDRDRVIWGVGAVALVLLVMGLAATVLSYLFTSVGSTSLVGAALVYGLAGVWLWRVHQRSSTAQTGALLALTVVLVVATQGFAALSMLHYGTPPPGSEACWHTPETEHCADKLAELRHKVEQLFPADGSAVVPPTKARKQRVSVILMSYRRPATLVKTLLPELVLNDRVAQVIISHGSTTEVANFTDPKIVHLMDHTPGGLQDTIGLSRRFRVAEKASEPWVIIMDDDILPSKAGVDQLLAEFARSTDRIVGKWGRNAHMYPLYNTVDAFGEVDVVLTKYMVLRRDVIPLFFDFAELLGLMPMGLPAHSGLMGSSRWNGEDIFMSMVHHHCTGRPNYAIPNMGSVVEFESSDDHGPGGGGAAVGGNIAGNDALMWAHTAGLKTAYLHGVYRSAMWVVARHRLNSIARYTGHHVPSISASRVLTSSAIYVLNVLPGSLYLAGQLVARLERARDPTNALSRRTARGAAADAKAVPSLVQIHHVAPWLVALQLWWFPVYWVLAATVYPS